MYKTRDLDYREGPGTPIISDVFRADECSFDRLQTFPVSSWPMKCSSTKYGGKRWKKDRSFIKVPLTASSLEIKVSIFPIYNTEKRSEKGQRLLFFGQSVPLQISHVAKYIEYIIDLGENQRGSDENPI